MLTLSFGEYQQLAMRTKNRGEDVPLLAPGLCIAALGLAGEAGEAAEVVKKTFGHGKPLNVEKMMDEVGDVLWYAASVAEELGVSLEDIATRNIEKLRNRYPERFTSLRRDVDYSDRVDIDRDCN